MALSATRLKGSMLSKMIAKNPTFAALSASDRAAIADSWFETLAEAIVEEITGFAQVSTSVTVTSVTGVTTGAGTSGPGSGSGSGSIL